MAQGILLAVFGGFDLIALLHILGLSPGPAELALSTGAMAALLWLQLSYFCCTTRTGDRYRYLALLAQAVLVYLPTLVFGLAWFGMPGFLAGSALLVLSVPWAWIVFGLVIASVAAAQAVFDGGLIDIAYAAVSTMISGLVVYGLTRLAGLVVELHAARTELAQMAVAQERTRFARDLHDLLGYSLSAITLKSELTRRLVVTQPARAEDELSEVLSIARRALADVRSVAAGYRELSLEAEARSARSVLLAAEVDPRIELDCGDLPVQVATVLATVLREGVTNVLRHSKADHCEITVRQHRGRVTVDIVNDGVQDHDVAGETEMAGELEPVQRRIGGSGIENLSARVAALDGTLRAGLDPDGRWRLHATAHLPRGTHAHPAGAQGAQT